MPPCAFGLSVVLLSLSGVMGAGPRDSPAPPLIHLRTGTINILETPARRGPPTSVGTVSKIHSMRPLTDVCCYRGTSRERFLAEAPAPMLDRRWGPGAGAHQVQ